MASDTVLRSAGMFFALALALFGSASIANACLPPPPATMLFDHMSTTSAQMSFFEELVRAEVLRNVSLNRKCGSFVVSASADEAEMKQDGGLVAAKRTEIARRVVALLDAPNEQIEVEVGTGTRHATVAWRYTMPIRLRCDPTSLHVGDLPVCSIKYSRCYLELDDSTVCAPKVTPDMNSAKYSVDSTGKPLNQPSMLGFAKDWHAR